LQSLEVGMVYAVFIAAGIPGPYFWGYMSDKLGRRKAVMFTMSMAFLLWYLLSYGGNQFTLLSILVPLGFVTAGVGGVIQAFVAEVTDPENRDLVYGVYFTLCLQLGPYPQSL